MTLSRDQILQMAPDPGAAAAGNKLRSINNWKSLGADGEAIWGICMGSADYQVKLDRANNGYHCSCPSRKFPCKHVLGLFLLHAETPSALSESKQPEWLTAWIDKRREREAKKANPPEAKPVDVEAQRKRAERREDRVSEGVERLDLWMKDLVRGGLAGLEAKPPAFWHDQARRLVDAQAPGLAARVSRLGLIPATGASWPTRFLSELGKLALLLHAQRRIDQLEPGLASEIRQLIGWNVNEEELTRDGESVEDDWFVLGQTTDDTERIHVRRTWCLGANTKRMALVLHFAVGGQPFADLIAPGTVLHGRFLFYPGASRQRAKPVQIQQTAWTGGAPGHDRIEGFLHAVAEQLSKQPWLTHFGCALRHVTFGRRDDQWYVVDKAGDALPLADGKSATLLAITGGHPCELYGEWTDDRLTPLGVYHEGIYRALAWRS